MLAVGVCAPEIVNAYGPGEGGHLQSNAFRHDVSVVAAQMAIAIPIVVEGQIRTTDGALIALEAELRSRD
jgi:hypothetical protein